MGSAGLTTLRVTGVQANVNLLTNVLQKLMNLKTCHGLRPEALLLKRRGARPVTLEALVMCLDLRR